MWEVEEIANYKYFTFSTFMSQKWSVNWHKIILYCQDDTVTDKTTKMYNKKRSKQKAKHKTRTVTKVPHTPIQRFVTEQVSFYR